MNAFIHLASSEGASVQGFTSTSLYDSPPSLLPKLIFFAPFFRSESVVVVGRVSRGECEAACACLRVSREHSLRRAPPPSGGLKLIPRPVIYRALLLLMSRGLVPC